MSTAAAPLSPVTRPVSSADRGAFTGSVRDSAVAPEGAVARALARIARAAAADADDRPEDYLDETAVRHGGE